MKIIMLTRQSELLTYMYNGLADGFTISSVIVEEKTNKKAFLKRRIKRLGYFKVFGQVLFQLTIPKALRYLSTKRIDQIKSIYNLDHTPIPNSVIKNVSSVNSVECIAFLKKEKPDLIIVNGTRIISKKVLNTIDATFVNTHGGITPKYRGVYGGYWAIANKDPENFGVTLHIVDSGIDTGAVLYQNSINIVAKDNTVTYAYLLVGEGIKLMRQVITDFNENKLTETLPKTTESNLWHTPTLWYYLYKRLFRGVK